MSTSTGYSLFFVLSCLHSGKIKFSTSPNNLLYENGVQQYEKGNRRIEVPPIQFPWDEKHLLLVL